MNKKKGKPDKQPTYQEELEHNEHMLMEIMKSVDPNAWVLLDLMHKTNINPMVIFKFIRQAHNIMVGSRFGQVSLVISDGVARYIKGEDTDRIEEPVIIEKEKLDKA
jgi:hypothetical protein